MEASVEVEEQREEQRVPPSAPQNTPAIAADAAYEQVLRRAAWIGGHGRSPLVSFPSLVLALGGGGSETLDWLKATLRELQPQWVARLYAGWKAQTTDTFPKDLTTDLARRPPPLESELPADDDHTPSAKMIMAKAAELAAKTGTATGVRHLIVATLLAHADDFTAWQIPRRSILARYLAILSRDFPSETATWAEAIRDGFPWAKSQRLLAIEETARKLAIHPSNLVEVEDLVVALLLEAVLAPDDKSANAWLLAALEETELPAAPATTPPRDKASATALLAWLDVAHRYALTGEKDELNTRHVVAALLSPAGPAAGKQQIRQRGGDPIELARGLVALMREAKPGDDLATWEWLLRNDAPPPELRKPRYSNDYAEGTDLIGIDGDVRALASVLAAKDTHAPLSVGLFGDWGSGKSFFMRKMREHISRLEGESQKSTGETVFCKAIAQVEFNAWHYMDNDVWSSIVVHLLEQLDRRFVVDEQRKKADAAKESLAFIDLQRAQARSDLETATQAIEKIDAQLAAPVPAHELERVVLIDLGKKIEHYLRNRPDVKAAITDLETKLGVAPGSVTIPALAVERDKALGWMGQLGAWWRDLRRNPANVALVLACAMIPIVLLVVGSLADRVLPMVLAAVGAITGAVAAVKDVAAKAKPLIDASRTALTKAQEAATRVTEEAGKELLAQRAIEDGKRIAAEKTLDELDAKAAPLVRSLEPVRLSSFREYVLERVKSADYRDRQGIVALVNREFQNLSARLQDDASQPKLDRIVLYIDDLDRCTPERVVEVLQAIHLMLSFDLFIVVVAVDSSWLLESLKAYYARQFPGVEQTTADWSMRPQFYLEKIFQLPYTLLPLDGDGFKQLVGGLMSDEIDLDLEALEGGGNGQTGSGGLGRSVRPGTNSVPVVVPQAAGAAPPIDLAPRSLEITQAELAYMQSLGDLVTSPRAGKRLVNLYRIVRAGLHGDALAWFVDNHYQLTQVFLAAVVGASSTTASWFEQILDGKIADGAALRAEMLRRVPDDKKFQLLHDRLNACKDVDDWPRVKRTCRDAARYSFETGRLLAP